MTSTMMNRLGKTRNQKITSPLLRSEVKAATFLCQILLKKDARTQQKHFPEIQKVDVRVHTFKLFDEAKQNAKQRQP